MPTDNPLIGLDPNDAKAIRQAARMQPSGLGRALFDQTLLELGRDTDLALAWANHAAFVARVCDDVAWAWRARAVGQRLKGQWSASAQSFIQAGESPGPAEQKLSFQIGAIDSLARAGKGEEAVRLGRRLVSKLDRLKAKELAARARLNLGNALLWQDRYVEARRVLDAAMANLVGADRASASLALSTAELFGGDPQRARDLAQVAAASFLDSGHDHFVTLCRINEAQADILTGRAEDGTRLLMEVRDRLRELHERARIEEFLGDGYARLNLWTEAADAYRAALAMKPAFLNRANVELGLGRIHLARGDVARGLPHLNRAQRHYKRALNGAWAAATELELARHAQGKLPASDTLGPYHQTLHDLLVAERESSNRHVGRALRRIRKYGFVDLEWRVHELRARQSGQLVHFRRMFEAMLSARALTRSTTSRASFLSDKAEALKSYLERLLAKPSQRHVREALDVISRSRSVALADEILSSRPDVGTPEFVAEIEKLRAVFSDDPPAPGTRRKRAPSGEVQRAQRAWHERTSALFEFTGCVQLQAADQALIFVEGTESWRRIASKTATRLESGGASWQEELRWLWFELLAPLANPLATSELVCRDLTKLAKRVLPENIDAPVVHISPEAEFWAVPWQACASLVYPHDPTIILLPNPGMGTEAGDYRLPQNPNVVIWLGSDPDLEHVSKEVHHTLSRYPGAKVCRTLHEVQESLNDGKVDLLHVAAHGSMNPENPMFSFFEFAGGRLYALDIARARFQVDLAILSACETGQMAVGNRSEPDGLARAFLARRAQAVVGSMWPLDDACAELMVGELIAGLKAGSTVSDALRSARRAGRKFNPHPYFWAGLALFGGYQPT